MAREGGEELPERITMQRMNSMKKHDMRRRRAIRGPLWWISFLVLAIISVIIIYIYYRLVREKTNNLFVFELILSRMK